MRKTGYSDHALATVVIDGLRRRLPDGWELEERPSAIRELKFDEGFVIAAPDRRQRAVGVAVRQQLVPRAAQDLASRLRGLSTPVLVVARYLTPTARERLVEGGLSYADLSGNMRIAIREPGLFIETEGSFSDPDRVERPARSLRGPKAGRIVRALCDLQDPVGVRELAERAGVDAGYASRILGFLDREALIERVPWDRSASGGRRGTKGGGGAPPGRVTKVYWNRLIRRWARDAPFESRGRAAMFIDPRGVTAFVRRLRASGVRHAVTGSAAARAFAPFATTRMIAMYVEDLVAAERLDLRPPLPGGSANVILAWPADDVVFDRCDVRNHVAYASPAQVAADLLTGPGRIAEEAEALLGWMAANEASWRREVSPRRRRRAGP